MRDCGPIISKLGKPIKDEELGGDHYNSRNSGRAIGVRYREFKTPEGQRFYYYKEVFNKKEAKRIWDIYHKIKNLGLPVMSFIKFKIEKDEDGNRIIYQVMDDLTESGKFILEEVKSSINLLEIITATERLEVLCGMVIALSKLHNAGIYHYHPWLSFAIRCQINSQSGELEPKDFVVMDYDNYVSIDTSKEDLPEDFEDWMGDSTPEEKMASNLFQILNLCPLTEDGQSEEEQLEGLYKSLRDNND